MQKSTDVLSVSTTAGTPVTTSARPRLVLRPKDAARAQLPGFAPAGKTEPAGCTIGLARLLTVRDVADTLAVSVRQVWKLVSLGELPVVRIGRCARFDPRDVQAWIERQKEARR